jgi:hypothetical protein
MLHYNTGNWRPWTRIFGTICISVTPSKRLRSLKLMFSIPKPPSYMWKVRNVWVLDPKGLAVNTWEPKTWTYTNVLNLSWGLTRYKIWFENKVFESPLEICQKINSRKRTRQSLEKWRESLRGTTWEESIETSQGQSHHYKKQTNVPQPKTEEHMFMAEEHNWGTYLDKHKSAWTSGPRNISYVPQPRGTEEHKRLCSSGNRGT